MRRGIDRILTTHAGSPPRVILAATSILKSRARRLWERLMWKPEHRCAADRSDLRYPRI
jgi:hypothetical protein